MWRLFDWLRVQSAPGQKWNGYFNTEKDSQAWLRPCPTHPPIRVPGACSREFVIPTVVSHRVRQACSRPLVTLSVALQIRLKINYLKSDSGQAQIWPNCFTVFCFILVSTNCVAGGRGWSISVWLANKSLPAIDRSTKVYCKGFKSAACTQATVEKHLLKTPSASLIHSLKFLYLQ